MRSLIKDTKIISILDEIEPFVGNISIDVMPKEHRILARCSIAFNPDKGWTLLDISENNTSQATLCHELSHLILLIEGYPAFNIDLHLPKSDSLYQVVSLLYNLVLHINVWEIVNALGFDEAADYTQGLEDLITLIKKSQLLSNSFYLEDVSLQAAYLANGLLCPSAQETRKRLRDAASQAMPKSLELSDQIIQIFERLHPLSPQSSVESLSEICVLLKIHRSSLIAVWPDMNEIGFRNRFLP